MRGRRGAWTHLVALLAALALLGSCSAPAAPDGGVGGPSAEQPPPPPTVTDPPPGDEPAPPAVEPTVELPPPPASRARLEERLARYIAGARAADPELSLTVLVVDEHGREVVALDPDRPVLPASTLKVLTAAAVLTTLGPDTRLTTRVEATAGIDGDGILDGDLVLRGVGDPTLVTDAYARYVYPARPHTPLDALADGLVDLGLRRLTGDVLGDAPGFTGEPLPTGWRDNYLPDLDGRYVAGLTVDGGLRTLVEEPDDEDGDDEDGDGDDEDGDEDEREEEDDAERPPPIVRVELATDPVVHAATELLHALEERGVRVDGAPGLGPPEAPVIGRLAAVSSPPLADVLRFMVQRSDNHLADQLFQVIARARTGDGSWGAGERALQQVLARFGVDAAGGRFADGSGLSRDDRVTARMLVDLDRALSASPRWGEVWRSLQAVAGESGTLSTRLRGTPAVGRFLGKTGTLRDVTAVSGQVIPRDPSAADAPRFHLAVLAHGGPEGRQAARALMDETVLALLAELDGCRLLAIGDEAGPLGVRPRRVAC